MNPIKVADVFVKSVGILKIVLVILVLSGLAAYSYIIGFRELLAMSAFLLGIQVSGLCAGLVVMLALVKSYEAGHITFTRDDDIALMEQMSDVAPKAME